jgi:hypothetical protein
MTGAGLFYNILLQLHTCSMCTTGAQPGNGVTHTHSHSCSSHRSATHTVYLAASRTALQKMSMNSIISISPISQPMHNHSLPPPQQKLFKNYAASIPMYITIINLLYAVNYCKTHAECHSPLFFPRRGHMHKNRPNNPIHSHYSLSLLGFTIA